MSTSLPPRPPLPALGLPRSPRRLGPGALVALVAHIVVIGAVIWERTRYLESAVSGSGPRGGGGGGEQLQYVALAQAAEAPKQKAVPPPVEAPVPVPEIVKLPEPEPVEIAPVAINPVPVAVIGAAEGTGSGPGSGGGTGTGTGTGTGSHEGPGTGGDGSFQPAVLRGLIVPPPCVSGHLTIVFSVSADGRVDGVDVDPAPKDGGCRRELVTRMRQYKFSPARTRDGRAVASTYPVKIER